MTDPTPAALQLPVTGTYRIDTHSSTVAFTVRHMFGTASASGTFTVDGGEITLADPPETSAVTAAVSSESFDTGNGKRDVKVRSAQFLDSRSHPQITFRSTAVVHGAEGSVVRGDLTARGVEAPFELRVTALTTTATGLTVEARGSVDRYAHGVTAMKGIAARRLDLVITAKADRI